jgi:V8-like Glu-specific endopeptidase
MKAFRLTFLTLLIFSGCSSSFKNSSLLEREPANIFYKDDRQRFELIDFPQWGHLHQSKDLEKPWGTAFLIHSCYIATAYHVVKPTIEEITGEEERFFETPLFEEPISAKPVLWGEAWTSTKETLNGDDWAVLKLSKCFPEKVKPLTLLDVQEHTLLSMPLIIAGFPEDRDLEKITVDLRCNAGPEPLKSDTGFGHDCATRPGNSGSPLMTLVDNKAQVVGIAVAAKGHFEEIIIGYSGWISNKACPIGPLKKSFEKFLNEEIKKGPQSEGPSSH